MKNYKIKKIRPLVDAEVIDENYLDEIKNLALKKEAAQQREYYLKNKDKFAEYYLKNKKYLLSS